MKLGFLKLSLMLGSFAVLPRLAQAEWCIHLNDEEKTNCCLYSEYLDEVDQQHCLTTVGSLGMDFQQGGVHNGIKWFGGGNNSGTMLYEGQLSKSPFGLTPAASGSGDQGHYTNITNPDGSHRWESDYWLTPDVHSTIHYDSVVVCGANQQTINGVCECVSGTTWDGRACSPLTLVTFTPPPMLYEQTFMSGLLRPWTGAPGTFNPCPDGQAIQDNHQCGYVVLMGTIDSGMEKAVLNIVETQLKNLITKAFGMVGRTNRGKVLTHVMEDLKKATIPSGKPIGDIFDIDSSGSLEERISSRAWDEIVEAAEQGSKGR